MEDVKPTQTKKWYMDWQLDDHMTTREMLFGVDLSARSNSPSPSDLLQNCDLPPPLRFFSPFAAEEDAEKTKISSISYIPAMQHSLPVPIPNPSKANQEDERLGSDRCSEESTSLLRALQLSQTRAREAEKSAALERTRSQEMARVFLEDSLKLSAYRQWVKLLEVEICMLQSKGSPVQEQGLSEEGVQQHGMGDEAAQSSTVATWCLTVAFCLGIATVGFLFGPYVF